MGIQELINANADQNQVYDIALASLGVNDPNEKYTKYFTALDKALKRSPPPFDTANYTQEFEAAAENPHWLATSLITNSQREGDGATRLWSLAACCDDEETTQQLKKHAIDESGHSFVYLKLLDLVFPGAVTDDFREELKTLSPQYSYSQDPQIVDGSPYARVPSLDDFIQMNIAEIRTTIHHLMQRKAIAQYCPPENLKKVQVLMDALMQDEMDHVAYTARIIEDLTDEGNIDVMEELYNRRLMDFNNITEQELKEKIFD